MGPDTLIRQTPERARLLDDLEITRQLTEVEHFNRLRLPDGSHHPATELAILDNLVPAVKEAGIAHAVSTVYQEKIGDDYFWLDKTSDEIAASGYQFHEHPVAHVRVGIEIDEDLDVRTNLRPGNVKVFLSPCLTAYEASIEVARREHLNDDDMVRIHWLDTAEDGTIRGKYMQSILVRDIPLPAWNLMLADSNNGLFDTSITVADHRTSQGVMEAHRQMHLPADRLKDGVVDVIKAVLPYVRAIDPLAAESVQRQYDLFGTDQKILHEQATTIARRWLEFERELADSLYSGSASTLIVQFVENIQEQCTDDVLQLLDAHTGYDGGLRMSRELAAVIEQMRKNTLWTTAGVITGNQAVISQLSPDAYHHIITNELFLQQLLHEGVDSKTLQAIENQTNKIIAKENINVGTGCPGELGSLFKNQESSESNKEKKDEEVLKCVTCPLCGKKGVDAHIKHNKEKKEKKITCSSCKKSKIYKT